MSQDLDTDRTSARTYVPGYQKTEWQRDADAKDMSLSEFIRCMVQAGRRGFEGTALEPAPTDVTPGGNALKPYLLDILAAGPQSFDDIEAAVRTDIEATLEELITAGELEQTVRGEFERP